MAFMGLQYGRGLLISFSFLDYYFSLRGHKERLLLLLLPNPKVMSWALKFVCRPQPPSSFFLLLRPEDNKRGRKKIGWECKGHRRPKRPLLLLNDTELERREYENRFTRHTFLKKLQGTLLTCSIIEMASCNASCFCTATAKWAICLELIEGFSF